MTSKLKPALLGGLVVGLLSAIPFVNYCCCIWGIGGGALAAYLYINSSPVPVKPGEGAALGGLAGIFGGLIYLVIGVPLAYLMAGAQGLEEQLARSGVTVPFSGALLIILGGIIGALILVVLAILGGVIAVPLFEKRKGEAPPPPPPAM
jgi:hypothetical protein